MNGSNLGFEGVEVGLDGVTIYGVAGEPDEGVVPAEREGVDMSEVGVHWDINSGNETCLSIPVKDHLWLTSPLMRSYGNRQVVGVAFEHFFLFFWS